MIGFLIFIGLCACVVFMIAIFSIDDEEEEPWDWLDMELGDDELWDDFDDDFLDLEDDWDRW